MGGLSNGLLDLSRLDAGNQLRSEPVELGELSRAVAAEFRAGPRRPRWIAPPHATWALGDPEGVARIVRLLVDNGLRHAPAPAPVEVRVEAVNGHALVRVLDGGTGVPESERDAIFDRFQRGAQTTAPGLRARPGDRRRARAADGRRADPRAGGGGEDEPRGARFALALPVAPTP